MGTWEKSSSDKKKKYRGYDLESQDISLHWGEGAAAGGAAGLSSQGCSKGLKQTQITCIPELLWRSKTL